MAADGDTRPAPSTGSRATSPSGPGELLRNSLQHVARGADGILFFQWRASRAGAEKYHAGLLPHAGTDTRVWREVVELRRVAGRRRRGRRQRRRSNKAAILFDWQAWWACELDSHPSVDVRYLDRAARSAPVAHRRGRRRRRRPPRAPTWRATTWSSCRRSTRVTDAAAARLRAAVEQRRDRARHLLQRHRRRARPRPPRRLPRRVPRPARHPRRGVPAPARAARASTLSQRLVTADVWTEDLHLAGAESVATYVDGPAPGVPAVTRHERRRKDRRGTSRPASTGPARTRSSPSCSRTPASSRSPPSGPASR